MEDDPLRWYSRALKIPYAIGRLPSGERIPGGPYTVAQAVTAGVLGLVGWLTFDVWKHMLGGGVTGTFFAVLAIAAVAAAGGWLARYLPRTAMNPAVIAVGAGGVMTRGVRPTTPATARPVRSRLTITPHLPQEHPTSGATTHPTPTAAVTPAGHPDTSKQCDTPKPATPAAASAANPGGVGDKLAALLRSSHDH